MSKPKNFGKLASLVVLSVSLLFGGRVSAQATPTGINNSPSGVAVDQNNTKAPTTNTVLQSSPTTSGAGATYAPTNTVTPTTTSGAGATANGNRLENSSPSSATIGDTSSNSGGNQLTTTSNGGTVSPTITTDPTANSRSGAVSGSTATQRTTQTTGVQTGATTVTPTLTGGNNGGNQLTTGTVTPTLTGGNTTLLQPDNSINKIDARVLAPNELRSTAANGAGETFTVQNGDKKVTVDCRDLALNQGIALNLGFGYGGQLLGVRVVRGNHALCAVPTKTVDRAFNSIIDTFSTQDMVAPLPQKQAEQQKQSQEVKVYVQPGTNTPPVVIHHEN